MPAHRVRRIISSVGANSYAQATTIGMQLLSLPAFLTRWDLATYGQWLTLSALPAYIALADVGMVTAAANRMTMLVARGEQAEANRVFQSTMAFVLLACAAAALVVLGCIWLVPADMASEQNRWAIVALVVACLFTLIGGLPEAIYRATERYAMGTALSNTIRIFEWAGSLCGLFIYGTFAAVAVGALLPRVIGTLLLMLHTARSSPDFGWSFKDASTQEVRRTIAPAMSFMAFPAANALGLQGMTLVVAATLGPAATATFNVYRTMARVTVQATGTFSHALWTEFSRLFGRDEKAELAALYRKSSLVGFGVAAAASAVVYLAAPSVLHVWSKGRIAFDSDLMLLAMVYAAVAGCWHVARVLLLSTNRHAHLAWQFLAASTLSLPLGWVLCRSIGIPGAMAAMLAGEAVMLLLCTLGARKLVALPSPALVQGARP